MVGRQTTDYETWYWRQIPWTNEPVPDIWHAAWYQTGTAICGDTRPRLARDDPKIVPTGVDFTDVEQTICRRCLNHANRHPVLTRRDCDG